MLMQLSLSLSNSKYQYYFTESHNDRLTSFMQCTFRIGNKLQCFDATTIVSGIADDELRETAYEILLACAGASG